MPIPRTFSGPLHQKSYQYALRIVFFFKELIEKKEFILSKQLLRSATSVGANVEEAQQAQSKADFAAKMSIALKEACESRFWLRLLYDAEYSDQKRIDTLINDTEEIIAMLSKTVRSARASK